MNAKYLTLGLAAISLAAAGSCAAFSFDPSTWLSKDKQETRDVARVVQNTKPAAVLAPVPALAGNAVPNYRAIVQQSGPAVVGVTVEGRREVKTHRLPPGMDDPFFQFFRGLPGFGGRIPWERRGGERPFRGQGSGFILSTDGLILTNAHVVRDAKEVTVKLSDRREFKAKVLGTDPATDVAVLRIKAKNLPVVRVGNVERLQVGDPVLAIGSPFGFDQTATQGIVSAKGRSLPGDAAVPFIQTDAAVNPGNSGGPLFDGSGAVVGINAQIYSKSGGYQGLSFAIPINVALKVKDQIVATGKASHARLGVTIQDLNQTLAESFGLDKPNGALVASVSPGSAAAGVGLKSGDVITEVNGEPITRSGDLSSRIGMATPGETVRLKYWRDKAPKVISVKLGRAEDSDETLADGGSSGEPGRLGLSLRSLTKEERERLQLKRGGLLVERAAGPSARAGVVPGDVLVAINGQPVSSASQVAKVMRKKPKSVALLIQRRGGRIFVPVNLG